MQALRAKLEQQEAKINASEVEVTRQKAKRRTLRTQREEWKEKYVAQQSLAQAPAESVKEEEGSEDWKGMLYEQERKTEHYKLKYIALKEEKKVWQAQTTQEGRNNAEPETLHTSQETDLVQECKEAEPQLEHVQPYCNTERDVIRNHLSIKPTNFRELLKPLSRFWEAYKKPGMPNPPQRVKISQDLDAMYRKLYNLESKKAVDVTSNEVRTRLYITAVEDMEQILIEESDGVMKRTYHLRSNRV